MLGRLLKFPYANAKARALIAGHLGRAGLDELSRVPSRQSAVAFLRERGLVGGAGEGRAAETQLRCGFIAYGARVARSLPGREQLLLEAYLRRADVENIKTVCRGLLVAGKTDPVRPLLVPAEAVGGVSADLLCQAGRFEDLPAVLSRHPCGALLRQSLEFPPERRLHLLEMALDRAFWTEVGERLLALAPFDRRAAEEILTLRADVDRWHVVQRGWEARLSTEEILAALPPLGTAFPGHEVQRALRFDRPGDLLKKLFPVKGVEDPFTSQGEMALFRRLHRQLRRALVAPPFDIALPLAAVLLKELEVRDLQTILGGLRLRRGPPSFTPLLASMRG